MQLGHHKAIFAVAHQMLVTAYTMLSRSEDYRELGEDYFDQKNKPQVTNRLLHPQSLPVQKKTGGHFDLLPRLQTLKNAGVAGEWRTRLPGTAIEGRVCALRKSEEAIQQAHRRIERRAIKNRRRQSRKPGDMPSM
jgi:hypothetical protein